MKKKYSIKGMSCASCVNHVEKAVKKIEDVNNVVVSLMNNTLELETTTVSDEVIIKAVKKAGFKASVFDGNNDYLKESNIKKSRLIISCILLVLLLYIAMGNMMGLPQPIIFTDPKYSLYYALSQVIVLIPIIILNFNYFTSGYSKLFKRNPNMDSLVAVGATASMIYGIFAIVMIIIGLKNNDMVLLEKYHMDLYFESAGTILTIVSIGKYIESRSKGKTSESIRMLLDLSGKVATVIKDEQEIEITVDEICIGDIIKVIAGGSVAVDGVIVKGCGSFNEANITGESIPTFKEENDKVISGSICLDSVLYYKATSTSKDSTIANIVKMVEEAANSKAPISRLADKISAKFVPVVMILSVITFVLWIIFSKDLELSLSIGISVLVVSCPCALGLATPIAIMIATGVACKNHVLIKDAKSLENLHNIDTVVFDKTGTITTGKLKIVDVVSYDDKFINILGSLEKHSNHPLAKAINEYVIENNIEIYDVNNHNTIPGKGVSGEINNVCYFAGNKKYIESITQTSISEINTHNSVVILASDKVLGYIIISDEIKQSSIKTIKFFKENKVKTIMLTGDTLSNANYVKQQVDVDEVIAEVLPSDKGEVIKSLKQNHKVLMIGDGINDAVALEFSDIAMAIGNGSDIAISAADIILTSDDLSDAYLAYELSKKTIRNIKYSLFWAFFYNIICIPIACGILYPFFNIKFNPMFASIAMSLSSICVVINALRLFRFKKGKKYDS